jgi:hypothetical protein
MCRRRVLAMRVLDRLPCRQQFQRLAFFRQAPLDILTLDLGELGPEQPPVSADIVLMNGNPDGVEIRHLGPLRVLVAFLNDGERTGRSPAALRTAPSPRQSCADTMLDETERALFGHPSVKRELPRRNGRRHQERPERFDL